MLLVEVAWRRNGSRKGKQEERRRGEVERSSRQIVLSSLGRTAPLVKDPIGRHDLV
jgi:hypothetical protein